MIIAYLNRPTVDGRIIDSFDGPGPWRIPVFRAIPDTARPHATRQVGWASLHVHGDEVHASLSVDEECPPGYWPELSVRGGTAGATESFDIREPAPIIHLAGGRPAYLIYGDRPCWPDLLPQPEEGHS